MKRPWVATLATTFLLPSASEAVLDSNTLQCAPHFFVPFTFSGVTTSFISSSGEQSIGFSHMAAAWMAMEHFNQRDTSVIPELGDELFQDCDVTFRMERNGTGIGVLFYDTSGKGHQGSQLMYQASQGNSDGGLPCALVGPYSDLASMNIATMASSAGVPHIPSGGQDARLSEHLLNPFTSVISPRIMDMTGALALFLKEHQRTNYVATLFAFSETGNQFQEGIAVMLDIVNATQRKEIGYLPPNSPVPLKGQSIRDAIVKIKETGFRTIIVTMANDIYDLPYIADVVDEMGMNTADYLWIFLPPYQHESIHGMIDLPDSLRELVNPPLPSYKNVRKLLSGAALLQPVDGFQVDPEGDKLVRAWRSVDESFIERLTTEAMIMTTTGVYPAGEYESTNLDYFRTYTPEPGSSYVYDATMAVGIGACIAERQLRNGDSKKGYISSLEHLAGMRMANFSGASGHVEFGISMGLAGNTTGARLPTFMSIGVFNLFPPTADGLDGTQGPDKSYVLTSVYTDLIDQEEILVIKRGGAHFADYMNVDEYNPFYFRDGTTTAPLPLRDPADQNYLSPALRYVGISLMGISLTCCAAFGAWVVVHRGRRIVRAAQPDFLYLLIFGAALMLLSIFGISTDENWGFTAEQLGRHCMSIVWLASLGHIVTYGALFTKLWRVNKVLQFSRRKISISTVAWPSALLMVAALLILTIWTIVDPLQWNRFVLDEETGESIGQCDSETMRYFILALGTVMMIPTVLTGLMAWLTRDVDDSYSEHSWIFTLIVIQLQVIFVGIPLAVVLRDVSTDGKYIGLLLLLWFMPMSTILLILLPKVIAHRSGMQGMTFSERNRGSTNVGCRVSGLPESASMSANGRRASAEDARRSSDGQSRPSTEPKEPPAPDTISSGGEFAEDSQVQ